MAIIDPEGLFGGERLAACSDLAQLYWPRFFLAANGCGRLELTYKSLISRVFGSFQKIPESSEIWGVFREYEANYLAVIYESTNGGWWCQFITSEKFLPRFKTMRDSASPAPSYEAMESAHKGYLGWKKAKSVKNQSFQKNPESFGWRGVGVGIGVGEDISDATHPPSTTGGEIKKTPERVIYEQYPRKVKPRAALTAITAAVERIRKGENGAAPIPDKRQAQLWLYGRTRAFARSPAGTRFDKEHIPHPASWFNAGQYHDDEKEWQITGGSNGKSNAQTQQTRTHNAFEQARIPRLDFEGTGADRALTGSGSDDGEDRFNCG